MPNIVTFANDSDVTNRDEEELVYYWTRGDVRVEAESTLAREITEEELDLIVEAVSGSETGFPKFVADLVWSMRDQGIKA